MYREVLVYTSTGDTAPRMSEYAAAFASALNARLAGLVVEVDFIDYSEIDRASESDKASIVEFLLKHRARTNDTALRAGALFEKMARQRNVLDSTNYKTCVSAEIPDVLRSHCGNS